MPEPNNYALLLGALAALVALTAVLAIVCRRATAPLREPSATAPLREPFQELRDPALSLQGEDIVNDVMSNQCMYEGIKDHTGVLTSPGFSDMWNAINELVPPPSGTTRCYITHPIYTNPSDSSLPCSRDNARIFSHDYYSLVSDIAMVDLGPSIGKQCAVTFNNGYPELYKGYTSFIELSDPQRKAIVDKRDEYRGIATQYETVLIPAANSTRSERKSSLEELQNAIIALDSSIAALESKLRNTSSEIDKVKTERAAVEAEIGDLTRQRDAALARKAAEEAAVRAAKAAEPPPPTPGIYTNESIPILFSHESSPNLVWVEADGGEVQLGDRLGGRALKLTRYRGEGVWLPDPVRTKKRFYKAKWHQDTNRIAMFHNNNRDLAIRHRDTFIRLDGLAKTYDWAWWFDDAGTDAAGYQLVYIRNDYPGDGARWYVGLEGNRVKIVKDGQQVKWRLLAA